MSDNDPVPPSNNNIIYARVTPEHIADVCWIMEGYEHLALVGTVDGAAGIIRFAATPDTYLDVLEIIENMPFDIEILESTDDEW